MIILSNGRLEKSQCCHCITGIIVAALQRGLFWGGEATGGF